MKNETYEEKLKDLLQAEQFSERKNLTESVIMKIEKMLDLLEWNKEVGGTAELKSEIMDQTANTHKLLTQDALHKQGITRHEKEGRDYRSAVYLVEINGRAAN